MTDQLVKDQKEKVLVATGKMAPELVFKNATFVNVFTNELEAGDIAIHKGFIVGIGNYSDIKFTSEDPDSHRVVDCSNKIICPGFIDGHIHIESSMLSPAEFAVAVIPHGTTCVITDPHEIANVAGTAGIDYMLSSTEELPLDVYMMLPSCVPATSMDESGAVLEAEDLAKYFNHNRVLGLAELMNSYGTIQGDEGIFRKLAMTKEYNKLVDGHAPGLQGNGLNGYITAGVTSDHECSTVEDALAKFKRGQWIMIREGTAAKNMDALMPLFKEPYCNRCMLVTDDKHPGDLIQFGHIDYLIRKAIKNGANPICAIKMATKQPAEYFGLRDKGAIAPGYKADLVILEDLQNVRVEAVYKNGKLVAQEDKVITLDDKILTLEDKILTQEDKILTQKDKILTQKDKNLTQDKITIDKENPNYYKVYHSFHMKELTPNDFKIEEQGDFMRVIELVKGELLTRMLVLPYSKNGVNDNEEIIKLAVIERHHNSGHIGLGFLKGYGMRSGAVASSISHDSHNLIVAGTNDEDMCVAANCVKNNQGGIAVVADGKILGELALPIAGLMCEEKAEYAMNKLTDMKDEARKLGVSEGIDPFMTLAFISLPVIPEIRLTTHGLAEVEGQKLIKTIF